jgi:predicted dehydrogenase
MAATGWTPTRLVDRYLAGRTLLGSVGRRLTGAPGHTAETFAGQLAAWAAALRGAAPSAAADGAAGARCVELVEACRQSLAVGGEWVTVPTETPSR